MPMNEQAFDGLLDSLTVRPTPQNPLYITACEVHAEIVSGAQTAAQGIYQMAQGFKRMRDENLYEALGYITFADYCEKGAGMNRQNVYKYIQIAEKIPQNFIATNPALSKEKLLLLSAISEEQREQMLDTTNISDSTVKELKAKIKELKDGKDKEVSELKAKLREMESSPVDVTQSEDYIRLQRELEDSKAQLAETIKDEEEKRFKLEEQIEEYQQKLSDLEMAQDDVTQSDEYIELSKQLEKLREEQESAEKYRISLEDENDELETQLKQLETELKERQEQPANVVVERDENDIVEIERLKAELADAKNDVFKMFILKMSLDEWKELTKLCESDKKFKKFSSIIKSAKML